MINEKTEERAALYVLDLLESEEKDSFVSELEDSPELQKYVRELSAGLHEPLKSAAAPSREDLLPGILSKVSGTENSLSPFPGKASESRSATIPWSYIWSAAAGILLLMNLVLLFLLGDRSSLRTEELLAASELNESGAGVLDSGQESPPGESPEAYAARITRLESDLEAARNTIGTYEGRQRELARENETVREFNDEWKREYALLAARFLPFFEPNDGMGRFTVIEMVDAEAFSQDLPRRGFADLAGRFLTGEGNIAGINPEDFVGPIVEGAGASAAEVDTSGSVLTPMAGTTGAKPPDASSNPPDGPGASDRPTGFTVWRDDEQKGFLDLYNLPEPPEGHEAYLWVRSSDLDPYIPVGHLPVLENGTGSMFYSVEEPNFTPADILITAEPDGVESSDPSGTVLLRGP